jgi:hypothetical protein
MFGGGQCKVCARQATGRLVELLNYRLSLRCRPLAFGKLSKVISELLFPDAEKLICVRLNQPEVMKALHKHADPGPRRAHHLRQFFMRDYHSIRMLRGSFLPSLRASCNNVLPSRCSLSTVTRLAMTSC